MPFAEVLGSLSKGSVYSTYSTAYDSYQICWSTSVVARAAVVGRTRRISRGRELQTNWLPRLRQERLRGARCSLADSERRLTTRQFCESKWLSITCVGGRTNVQMCRWTWVQTNMRMQLTRPRDRW